MRRILLVLAAIAVMVAMMAASATTAISQPEPPVLIGQCTAHEAIPEEFEHGARAFEAIPAHEKLPIEEDRCE